MLADETFATRLKTTRKLSDVGAENYQAAPLASDLPAAARIFAEPPARAPVGLRQSPLATNVGA